MWQIGLLPEVQSAITDDLLQKKPKQLIAHLENHGFRRLLTEHVREQVAQHRKHRLSKMKSESGIAVSQRTSFGGLHAFVERFSKEAVTGRADFDEHKPYVFGEYRFAAEGARKDKDVFFTISSENLLLNAYRQAESGFPPYIQIDYTHRLTQEKVANRAPWAL